MVGKRLNLKINRLKFKYQCLNYFELRSSNCSDYQNGKKTLKNGKKGNGTPHKKIFASKIGSRGS